MRTGHHVDGDCTLVMRCGLTKGGDMIVSPSSLPFVILHQKISHVGSASLPAGKVFLTCRNTFMKLFFLKVVAV